MQRQLFNATIAAGASLSDEVDLGMFGLVGVIVPANWTTADISFILLSGQDGITRSNVLDIDGAEIVVDAAAGAAHIFASVMYGMRRIIVRSGPASGAVAQAEAVSLTLIGVA